MNKSSSTSTMISSRHKQRRRRMLKSSRYQCINAVAALWIASTTTTRSFGGRTTTTTTAWIAVTPLASSRLSPPRGVVDSSSMAFSRLEKLPRLPQRCSDSSLFASDSDGDWSEDDDDIIGGIDSQEDDADKDPDASPASSGNNSKNKSIFSHARQKFAARPGTYLIIPVIAALVGWFTNYLAVQMIFYPIDFWGVPIWRRPQVPLGLLGWQGIVPCKTRAMSTALVEMVTSQLLTVQDAFSRLDPSTVAHLLASQVPEMGRDVLSDLHVVTGAPLSVWNFVTRRTSAIFGFVNVRFLTALVRDLIGNCDAIFSLQDCVVDQMVQDRAKLGQLFQKVGQSELDFLTNSGLWFGFLLGLIQMAVALVWDNPWSLSIGGMIVGLATNWLALKWIFEPVYPTQLGIGPLKLPIVVQGMFLRRQKEVAAEFSKFFAEKVVNSANIWNSILTDPSTTPNMAAIVSQHVGRLLNVMSLGMFGRMAASDNLLSKLTGSIMVRLQQHVHVLHTYVDKTLGLEATLRVRMGAMSPARFERVLHPIFEEDELTLIIAGGVLGLLAGLVQQGLETGAITISWSNLHRWFIAFPRSTVGQWRSTITSFWKNKPKRNNDDGAGDIDELSP